MKTLKLRCLMALVAALCIYGPAAAQKHQADVPLYDLGHPDRFIEVKPYVAIGFSTIVQNYGTQIKGLSDLQMAPGVLMRSGLDVRFALRNSLALGTGLSFDINNANYALSIVNNDNGSINSLYVNNHFYEITVPVYFSWRLNLGRLMRWNFDLGAYMAFGFGGSSKWSGYTSGLNSLGQMVITHNKQELKYFNEPKSVINGVKDFDIGPRLATGITYKRLYSFNIVFEVSAPNLAINHNVLDCKYRNIMLAFELGYNF